MSAYLNEMRELLKLACDELETTSSGAESQGCTCTICERTRLANRITEFLENKPVPFTETTIETVLRLQADKESLEKALKRASDVNDALRLALARKEQHLRLVRAEIARAGLVAERDW